MRPACVRGQSLTFVRAHGCSNNHQFTLHVLGRLTRMSPLAATAGVFAPFCYGKTNK